MFPDQTVRDNLLLGAYARRQPPDHVHAKRLRDLQLPRVARPHGRSGAAKLSRLCGAVDELQAAAVDCSNKTSTVCCRA